MGRADDQLFAVFGDRRPGGCRPVYRDPAGSAPPRDVEVCRDRDVKVAGADGIFRTVQHVAELRLCQVPNPRRGARLTLSDGEYALDEHLDTDGLVSRWSLLPLR